MKILLALVAATFLVTGASKVMPFGDSPANFARWALSPVMFWVGAAEIAGAIGLWLPRVRRYAAIGLIALMLGALRTGIVFGETLHIVLPLVLVALLAVIAKVSK